MRAQPELNLQITIDLPFPPSVNGIWRKWGRGVYRSTDYKAWAIEAGKEIQAQRPQHLAGAYTLTILFRKPNNRRRDLGNLEKPVSDLLVEHRIVEDDSLAEQITLAWTADPKAPPCQVVIGAIREVRAG